MKIIAHIYTDFSEKFGAPRQSGLVDELMGRIVFEPEYRCREAFTGLDGYSHIWLIWQFSESIREHWSPTVRPPRLGGNTRIGVFATRSPFRPNPLGLSSVKLEKVLLDGADGPELIVSGVDMIDGTPIYDIKPYLAYTDSHPDAVCGFADTVKSYGLNVVVPDELMKRIPDNSRRALVGMLAQDPRPGYMRDNERESNRVYGVSFCKRNVRFTVNNGTLTVIDITEEKV